MPARIGITMNQQAGFGATLRQPYYEQIARAGGLPLALPPLPPHLAAPLLDGLDGLLLAGGGDPDPAYFGAPPLPPLGEREPQRDVLELALIREAWQRQLPMLAICRGMQMLNIALGGSIWQDSSHAAAGLLPHRQQAPSDQPSHSLRISRPALAALLATDTPQVNSHHHQLIRSVAEPLAVAAYAPDGVIEALCPAGRPGYFCWGLQWHPERLANQARSRIFSGFVLAAQAYACRNMRE